MPTKTPDANELAIRAVRHALASIDLSDIDKLDKEVLTDQEYKQRAIDSEAFWRAIFRPVMKLFKNEQLLFMAQNASNNDITQFSRGTFNGLQLIEDWFDEQIKVALARFEKPSQAQVDLGRENYKNLIEET